MQKSLLRPLFCTFLYFLSSGNTSLVISIAKFEFSCKKTQVIFSASNDPRIWECHISNKQVLRSHFWEDSAIESDVEEPLLDILVPTWRISHHSSVILKVFHLTLFLSECAQLTSIGWKISNSRITFWFFSDYMKICWMFFCLFLFLLHDWVEMTWGLFILHSCKTVENRSFECCLIHKSSSYICISFIIDTSTNRAILIHFGQL